MSGKIRTRRGSRLATAPFLMSAAVAASVLSVYTSANAATPESYTGADGGSYTTATNWSPDSLVPNTSAFDAIINQSPGVTVNLGPGISVSVDSLTLGVGNTLAIQNNSQYTITGGTLSNNGVLSLLAGGNNAALAFTGDALISGAGTISLGSAVDDNTNAQIMNNNSGVLTIAATQVIEGAGQVGAANTDIINNGTIIASLSAGLILQGNSAGFTNNGLLLATGGNTLFLRSTGFINNSIIEAADLSFVRLDNGRQCVRRNADHRRQR